MYIIDVNKNEVDKMIGKKLSKDQLIEMAEKMKKDGKEVLVEEIKADMRGDGYYQLMLFQIVDGKKIFVKACSSYQKA